MYMRYKCYEIGKFYGKLIKDIINRLYELYMREIYARPEKINSKVNQ